MGIFKKPIRALDRLPSRFRPALSGAKPEGSAPAVGRPDAFNRPPAPPPPSRFLGPGNSVTIIIILLSGTLLAAILVLWRTGTAGPQAANGAPAPTPVAEQLASTESVDTLLGAAKSYVDQQDFAKAGAILRAAVRQHPDDQELRIAFGETLMRQKKLGEAYTQYAKALDIGPREPRIDFVAGTLASQTGRAELALEHYKSAQAADPSNAQYPLYLAQVQIKQRDYDGAKVNLLMSAKLDPQGAAAWGTLAELFLRENKLDLTVQNIVKARALQPELSRWKVVEARARARQGDPQKALILLSTLDRSEQRIAPALPLMAECYGLISRPADAASLYGQASDAEPTSADLAFEAAKWFDRAGDTEAGIKYAQRASILGYDGAATLLTKLKSK